MSLLSIFSKKPIEPTSVEEALAGAPSNSSGRSKNRRSEKLNLDNDSESVPEKKRARRRLIGALVMVLAVAIGLPMVLDSEPKPLNKDIVIQVSSGNETAIASQSKEETIQADSLEPKTASLQDSKTTDNSASPPAKPAANESLPASNKPKPSDDAKPAKNVDESSRALAILNGSDSAPAKPTATTTSTRIVVQVGAFATQAKVNELRGKLKSAGIKSFTQKVATSSGEKIRVRIGPFDDKESAEKVKLQLQKLGINGSLIAL